MELDKIDQLAPSRGKTIIDDGKCRKTIDQLVQQSESPNEHIPEFRRILWKYRQVLAGKEDQVGLCTAYKPTIPLSTKEPIYTPQYLVPYKMRQAMREAVREFLRTWSN